MNDEIVADESWQHSFPRQIYSDCVLRRNLIRCPLSCGLSRTLSPTLKTIKLNNPFMFSLYSLRHNPVFLCNFWKFWFVAWFLVNVFFDFYRDDFNENITFCNTTIPSGRSYALDNPDYMNCIDRFVRSSDLSRTVGISFDHNFI
jgi:hypothetical protein